MRALRVTCRGPGRSPRASITPSGWLTPSTCCGAPNGTVRRRVQNQTLGHRGRKHDPFYRIGKLLLAGAGRIDERGEERMLLSLRVGDSDNEVLGAWLAKESVRDLCATDQLEDATVLLDEAIVGRAGGARS